MTVDLELLIMDRMNLLLDLWYELPYFRLKGTSLTSVPRTSILFGILYLAFQAYPYIFGVNHGFSTQSTGLAFIGLGIGMVTGTIINIVLIKYAPSPSFPTPY